MSVLREIAQKVKELLDDLETLEKEKIVTFEYPFEDKEEYFCLHIDGEIIQNLWSGGPFDEGVYKQGHVFKNREEARKERDKRELLTRFRQFRDKCNGDWKPTINEKNIISFLTLKNKNLKLIGFVKLEYLNCWVPSKTKQMQNVLSSCSVMKLNDYLWRKLNEYNCRT